MKKIVYLIGVLILSSSCTCVLSQIPPQTIYANAECEAILPDYTLQVVASDNCEGEVLLMQSPAPGTLLTAADPVVDVLITGVDQFGNEAHLIVPVSLVDTIPPLLEWVEGVASIQEHDLINMYNNFEQAVKYHGIAEWVYNRGWVPDTLTLSPGAEQSLWHFTNTLSLDSTEYAEYLTYKQQ